MAKTGFKPFSNTELSSFCEQMSMLLHSGVSPLESIALMRDDLADNSLSDSLSGIYEELEIGSSFASSLEHSGVFPSYLINMVKIGENAGRLDEIFSALGDYYRREEEISQNIRHAVTYPMAMILMMLVVILVLIIKVLPIFNEVFSQLGSGLSGFSRGLMDFGQALSSYSVVFLVLLAVIALFVLFLFKFPQGKKLRQKMTGKLVIGKGISDRIAVSRFAFVMAVALTSGLDTDRSLEFAGDVTEHPAMKQKIDACRTTVAEGTDFSQALTKTGIFSGVAAHMLSLAFRAGTMDTAMKNISTQYQQEADERIDRIVSMLEPTLVAVLSVIVGAVLLSVMLPLLGVMAGL